MPPSDFMMICLPPSRSVPACSASRFASATAASVSTQPGETRTMRMPFGATSFDRLLLCTSRRLRGGIGRRRSRKRKLVLDRSDMNNDTGSLLDHRRQERPVDANSGHQVLIQLLRPLIVVDDGESTRRCARSAHDIDDDVDPAKLFRNRGCQGGAGVCRRKVRRDEMHTFRQCLGRGTGGRYYLDADVTQYGHDGGPNALCATRDKRTTVSELKVEAHGMISSDAILSPSSPKKNRRSTGLPGKLPVRWLVMTVFPSSCSDTKGSLVYVYLPSAFHFLMAAKPS